MRMNRRDDIEVRLCSNEGFKDESALVDLLEIYVQ